MATHEPDAAPASSGSVVTKTRTMRKPRGGLYTLLAVVVPIALTLLVVNLTADTVESTLRADGTSALAANKLGRVDLEVTGRVVTAKVPTGVDADAVQAALADVDGISDVEIENVFASKREAKTCATLQARIDRVTNKQRIPFEGTSLRLTAAGQRMLTEVGKLLKICGAATATVGGHTDDSTFNGATVSLKRARVMIARLKAQGIDAARLTPRGYGDQFPVSDGDTAAGRAMNQRGSVVVDTP